MFHDTPHSWYKAKPKIESKTMSFLKNIEWRRAVKSFAVTNPLPDIEPILQAAINAPSSFGIQPWKIIVVTDEGLKEKLAPMMHNQPQVNLCSHLLVFCARADFYDRIKEYVEKTQAPAELESMIRVFMAGLSNPVAWAKHQAYLALGFALAAATELRIASCPMEGFSADGVASVLNLPPTILPAVVLAIGNEDLTHTLPPRFRFERDDLVEEPLPHKSKYRSVTPMRKRKTG